MDLSIRRLSRTSIEKMGKVEFNLKSSSIIISSCIALALAICLVVLLRPQSIIKQSSKSPVHVRTENNPVPYHRSPSKRSSSKPISTVTPLTSEQRQQCYKICHLELVESLPENLTLPETITPPIRSTYESWRKLINLAHRRLTLAAYKSSFRGKHVLEQKHAAAAHLGDDIYEIIKSAAVERGIRLEAVENYPPRDRGDNEDIAALADLGLMERRKLHMARISRSGVMHSKFMLSDDSHFYLGSANFDWRSLNQKMELGVHVENCPCLANDLKIIYDTYWAAAEDGQIPDEKSFADTPALTSKSNPLTIQIGGVDAQVHLAASPRHFSGSKREWDLDAIINVIDQAKTHLDIHVMDYIPMYVYQKPHKNWPTIDNAIRRAVIDRGVKVRFLTAALHFTSETFAALRSLTSVSKAVVNGGRVDIKILKIPATTSTQNAFARERRTHRKFMVNDDTLLIGTSNWSGDYFVNTTGVAIVMRQAKSDRDIAHTQPLIDQAEQLFERDWKSIYSTDLETYFDRCYDQETKKDICKIERMAYQEA